MDIITDLTNFVNESKLLILNPKDMKTKAGSKVSSKLGETLKEEKEADQIQTTMSGNLEEEDEDEEFELDEEYEEQDFYEEE